MNQVSPCLLLLTVTWGALVSPLAADNHVVVAAFAEDEYTQGKFSGGRPRTETYVFMQGKYYDGATVDRSIERMPFRRIAEYLAPELARQQYLPGKDPATADLLLIVHWGTTNPRVTATEMRAQISSVTDTSNTTAGIERQIKEFNENNAGAGVAPLPALLGDDNYAQLAANSFGDEVSRQLEFDNLDQIADQVRSEFLTGSNANLLGYTRQLRQLSQAAVSGATEAVLRSDLAGERYFIIVRAYDLKKRGGTDRMRKPVWTIHLNIRSPGHNFPTALNMMGAAGADYFGRTIDGIKSTQISVRPGTVTLAPLIILGEQK